VQPLKVLIVAYACRPHSGSEPGVGWNLVQEMVKYHQVWLLTRSNNESAISAELALNPLPNLQVVYASLPKFLESFPQINLEVHLRYYLWQLQAYQVARALHQDVGFDLAHHVTYGRYCDPSFLALLPMPFVWGPLGGGESAPYSFWPGFRLRGQVYEACRSLSRWLGEKNPLVKLTARRCAAAVVSTHETAQRLQLMGVRNLKEVSGQTGINQLELEHLKMLPKQSTNQPIRFLSLGRLLHWKGFHLGLQGFAAAKLSNSEYWIVGDGPALSHLTALAKQLGIEEQVRWLGNLPREQALDALATCDVLVHPSLHDFSPTVCLEAMATGRPVICLDLGGPAGQITDESGIRVLANDPDQAVRDLSQAMINLAKDVQLREQMGQAGQERVRKYYSWESKGQVFAELYEQLTNT
jgi:glycosyltransferase involved in cell wall biosynthesis